jgi:hypothetical protein
MADVEALAALMRISELRAPANALVLQVQMAVGRGRDRARQLSTEAQHDAAEIIGI